MMEAERGRADRSSALSSALRSHSTQNRSYEMQSPSSLPPPPPLPFSQLSSSSPAPPTSSSSPFPSHSRNDSTIDDALSRDFPEVASLSYAPLLRVLKMGDKADDRFERRRREDMQLLLEDNAYFDAYFHTQLPRAVEMQEEVEQKMKENIQLARSSFSSLLSLLIAPVSPSFAPLLGGVQH